MTLSTWTAAESAKRQQRETEVASWNTKSTPWCELVVQRAEQAASQGEITSRWHKHSAFSIEAILCGGWCSGSRAGIVLVQRRSRA